MSDMTPERSPDMTFGETCAGVIDDVLGDALSNGMFGSRVPQIARIIDSFIRAAEAAALRRAAAKLHRLWEKAVASSRSRSRDEDHRSEGYSRCLESTYDFAEDWLRAEADRVERGES